MLEPGKLRAPIDGRTKMDSRGIGSKLARVAQKLHLLEEERRRIIDQYATEKITGEAYIAANRGLDLQQERLEQDKAKLDASVRCPNHEDFLDASIKKFCTNANAQLQASLDFDAKRRFLADHLELVIYDHYKVTITGSVLTQSATCETMLPFHSGRNRQGGSARMCHPQSSAGARDALELNDNRAQVQALFEGLCRCSPN
jgi:hypothetical protein